MSQTPTLADILGFREWLLEQAQAVRDAQTAPKTCRHRTLAFVGRWEAPADFKTPSFDLYCCKQCTNSIAVLPYQFEQLT